MTQPSLGYCETCDEFVSWATVDLHSSLGGHVVAWFQLAHEEIPRGADRDPA